MGLWASTEELRPGTRQRRAPPGGCPDQGQTSHDLIGDGSGWDPWATADLPCLHRHFGAWGILRGHLVFLALMHFLVKCECSILLTSFM